MSDIPDDEKRFSIEIYEDISDTDRREIIQMVIRLLDGDPVFAIENYEWEEGDGEKLKNFVENELKD